MKNKISKKLNAVWAAWMASSLLVKAMGWLIFTLIIVGIILTAWCTYKYLATKIQQMQPKIQQQQEDTNDQASVSVQWLPLEDQSQYNTNQPSIALTPLVSGGQVWTVQYGVGSLTGPWLYSGTNQFFD